jgi:hypothetical protein
MEEGLLGHLSLKKWAFHGELIIEKNVCGLLV